MVMSENKVAFVTGGGTGIGAGIARELLNEGYDLSISYCGSKAGAEEIVEYGKSLGRKVIAIKADISKVTDIEKMYVKFKSEFSHIDLFVNNAGLTKKATFLETTEELFDQVCGVDFKGAFFAMQNAAKIMSEQKSGNIILISSNNTIAHFADVSVYASVKTAAAKLAEHMAIELAQFGVRVNIVAPGWVDTGAARLDAKEETYYKIPLKKWATSEEVAKAVIYLASDYAASITGATLVMDNGAVLVSDKRERYGY